MKIEHGLKCGSSWCKMQFFPVKNTILVGLKLGFIPVQNAFYFGSECAFVCIFAKYSSVIGLFAPLCRKKVSVRKAIQRKKDWNMKIIRTK